ncbi:uncharacterized protein LOC105207644 [Solenopsis invicta]|uniref:uncharacterized protein LOC105207644 n=1 Tax=Solenopsis invicta TaxID=13686 RepID=UPI0005961F50|nr:uncharacterized protein LOC105207644 [Solenopsis invicta]
MSASAPDLDETITNAEYCIHDGYLVDDEVDQVDLSDLRLDDDDDWLYMPPQCPIESPIQDLYAWLKTEPELDVRNNKKCIDTRTFTRPKKRSARMSFESIFEGLSPPMTDIQKLQYTENVTLIENEEKYLSPTIRNKESVPSILKPSTSTAMNNLSDENFITSGQESLEAFLNMSQSKGIDSFINLGEPEFNDMLMNVSQPSVLYTSVIASKNESMYNKNDTVINENTAQNSDTKEGSNGDVNETFAIQDIDNTITVDEINYTENTLSNIRKEILQLNKGLNETFNTETLAGTSMSRSSLDKEESTPLSSTFVTEPNAALVQLQNLSSNGIKSLNTTYLFSAKDAERSNSPILINDTYVPTMHANKADLNVTCNILPDEIASAVLSTRETQARESALDISFKVPGHQSTPMNPNILDPTSKSTTKRLDQPQSIAYSTSLKAPTSLRRELLAEIQRSNERKLDATYNHIPSEHLGLRETEEDIHVARNETDIPPTNRYHTYKKTTTNNQRVSQNETAVTAQKELPMDQRKFYTFTKKSHPVERIDNIAGEIVETRPNMDSTFCKPHVSLMQQKKNIPRTLSKLPQFLQKSNPNLVSSSMKSAGAGVLVDRAGISGIGYIKGSQPNIMQNITEKSQLSSKLFPYGKIKSGSEQRLPEANVNMNNQFPMKGATAGSTESIESTHSVHSAPDLDDRLSTYSDNSNSCTKQTIEQLHKLVRMQEESLQQDSAPRHVLENTWIEEKINLPSPILKNGLEYSEGNGHSQNTDLSMKCSSPIVSPTGSSHALNNDGNAEGNVAKAKDETVVIEKAKDPNQVVPKIENKTRLRQPTNWSAGNKPAAVISGIPRPASRIPAPRFVRPSAKTTQSDLRKGCT